MKHAGSILAIAVAAFIVGCQENSIIDPINAGSLRDTQLPKAQQVNSLPLNAILHVPGNVHNSFVEIIGTVAYQATAVPLDPIPPNPQYAVRLNLIVNAKMRPYEPSVPLMSHVWYVSGTLDDWVPISEGAQRF
jgi:hypothetical protein